MDFGSGASILRCDGSLIPATLGRDSRCCASKASLPSATAGANRLVAYADH